MAMRDLRERMLGLPHEERARLARDLIESLEEAGGGDVEQAWIEEAEKRSRELDAGAVQTETWRDVRARISARLRSQRP